MNYFAPLMKDGYKVFHPAAYKKEVTHVFSNFTNRHNKHCNIENNKYVMFVGLQYILLEHFIKGWNDSFFNSDEDKAVEEYSRVVNAYLGKVVDVDHIRSLHKLGYLPLEVRALPEGTLVPYQVPCVTIENTVEGFGWCTNMVETLLSSELWPICTSATTAFAYRKQLSKAVNAGLPKELVPFMCHDFSYRGMFGTQAAAMSGFGHLCSFAGSDTIPAGLFAEKYYGAKIDEELVIASVDATEHSVMCSYGPEQEMDSLRHLMTNVTPSGILSVVSDTWDFWKLVTEYLPALKDEIMARDGTLVIRPDSGDPVEILCGIPVEQVDNAKHLSYMPEYDVVKCDMTGKFYRVTDTTTEKAFKFEYDLEEISEVEVKGLIECLWETFGGTYVPALRSDSGGRTMEDYKLLDSHIGAIYGDSITIERQKEIYERLIDKGFVPSVVLGIGSYSYQYVTRDTHGSAMKATSVQMDGKDIPIFKDPKTDPGKKSAKGLLKVIKVDGELTLQSDVSREDFTSADNLLKPVFKDGQMVEMTSLKEIREVVNNQL